jgi:2-hydroxy-6-oxonona-2,4-dienedioate hydrolase
LSEIEWVTIFRDMNSGNGDYLDVDGARTYFVRRGSGPALILLHGQPPGASVHVCWEPNIEFFAACGFTVYAFDQVGFGRSDNPTDFSKARRTAHARAFIEAMQLERFSLWGMSDGSYIACQIALADPRVERIVLMASGSLAPRAPGASEDIVRQRAAERAEYTPSLENARAYLMSSFANPTAITTDLVREMFEMSSGKNQDAHQARQALPLPPPIYDELYRLRIPVLLLWGANDSGGSERGRLLFEKIPGAELHIFDRCGHWVEWDQTARVNALVRDFLSADDVRPSLSPAPDRIGGVV